MSQAISVQDLTDGGPESTTMLRPPTEEEKRRLEAPLILGTSYTLNHSETKKVSIGLQPRADGGITPIVKLQNNSSAGGIVFESTGWSLLQTHLPDFSEYFEGSQKIAWGSGWRTPSAISIDDCEIHFTSSFGAKSIAFDLRNDERPATKDVDEDIEYPAKKRRKYSSAIVMQKPTFDGLLTVMVCIDERFRRLQRNVAHVQKCADVLCAELLLHIPANEIPEKVDEARIKELIKNNVKSLKEAVQLRLDPSFVDFAFGIVFLELSVLCVPFITNALRKALAARKK